MNCNTILVVDDESIQRSLLSEILSRSGDQYKVIQAESGIVALEILKQQRVDAVLLDKRMPDMDGDAVCRKIRLELHLTLLPIIMVTGTNSTEDLERSFSAGATDFINKPYNHLELLARLRSAVQKKQLTDQLDSAETLLFSLARLIEAKDETTGDHCSRLSHMSAVFGQGLGLSDKQLEALHRGGILHDIGKLGIPDSILLKKGPLSEEEWVIMRKHTVIGSYLCEGMMSMRDVVPIILHHHERWDGGGYPHGLAGERIPLLARIFQIVDIYDALASERPYKKALPVDEIVKIFQDEVEQGWRDPMLTKEFLKIVKNNSESLLLPKKNEMTMDERIARAIIETGVADWDKKQKNVS